MVGVEGASLDIAAGGGGAGVVGEMECMCVEP